MTDSDLRELDGWIAEKFMGWKRISPAPGSGRVHPLTWNSPNGLVTWETTSFSDAFRPSTLPSAFARVKREIERRGWGWSSECRSDRLPKYSFEVWDSLGRLLGWKHGEVEELAGCLAVKAAVEGSNG